MDARKLHIFTAIRAEANAIRKHHPPLPADCEVHVIGIRAVHLPWDLPNARGIIMAGFGGALDPSLRIGDVVIDDRGDRIHTSERIVATPTDKAELFRQTGAQIVDMENAIVRVFAARLNVPFIGIRAVSDTADDTLDPAVLGFVDELGRIRPTAIASAILWRPSLIPQLRQLAVNSKLAAEKLAAAVHRIVAGGFPLIPNGPAPAGARPQRDIPT